MNLHPVTETFPLMTDHELADLVEDIRTNGHLVPIETYKGEVIDGRNRLNACKILGVEPITKSWEGNENRLYSYVISLNLQRRNLSTNQRALIAASIGNRHKGRLRSNAPTGAFNSQAEAAEKMDVSRRSVQRGKKILTEGVDELRDRVETGEISLDTGAKIASLPKVRQTKILSGKGKLILPAKAKFRCLICKPVADASDDQIIMQLHKTHKAAPEYSRYIKPIISEIIETGDLGESQNHQNRILNTIEDGYQTVAEIQNITKIEKPLLKYYLYVMSENGMISSVDQGGKTSVARGQRKLLYQLADSKSERSAFPASKQA